MNRNNPDWRRPEGIQAGNWQYINNHAIAEGYDVSLTNSPLVTLDQQLIDSHLPDRPGVAIDFGCGTGRNAIPLLEKGWDVIGVDLSHPMLQQFADKIDGSHEEGQCSEEAGHSVNSGEAILVQANLTELNSIASQTADFGQCMFSTLGMIQGASYRHQFLRHASRILRGDSILMVHGHNYWHSLRQPGGWRWMIGNFLSAIRGKCEIGDRFADYRAVRGLMLHHFSLRALQRELENAGFAIDSTYAILENGKATETIGRFHRFNAVGWVVAARNVN